MSKSQKSQKDIENQEEIVEKEEKQSLEETAKEEKDLSDIIQKLEAEKATLKDEYLRAHAEMENLRKRTTIELEKRSKYAISDFARELLPVADNLDRALKALKIEEKDPSFESLKPLIDGIILTQKELESALAKNGVHKVPGIGKVFNPNYHKVIQEIENTSIPAGTILEEWQVGYVIGDRVLREAMVVVAKGGKKSEELNQDAPAGDVVDQLA